MALNLRPDTTPQQRYDAWRRVIERASEEQVTQGWRHRVFRLYRAVFETNPALAAEGGFLLNWATENYVDAALMVVRRELDIQAGTENLRNLLEDISACPEVLNRERYRANWQPTEWARADEVFATFGVVVVPGNPLLDHIDPAIVKADLSRVVQDGERLRVFAERTRAHRTREQGIDRSITFGELHQAIDDVRSVVGKYYALLTALSRSDWEPTPQYDTMGLFMRAWVTDPGAVHDALKGEA